MINISLTDLLNAPDAAPAVQPRMGGAAFTGLLDQFDRHQAEAPAKPSRPRAERTKAADQDDAPAKTTRAIAPVAAKAKPAVAPERDAAPTRTDNPDTQQAASGKAQPAPAAAQSDETDEQSDPQTADAIVPQTVAPILLAEQPVAPQVVLAATTTDGDDALSGISATDGATTNGDELAANALSAKADAKAKTSAPQMQTSDATTAAADDAAEQAPSSSPTPATNAQAADLSKRLENQPMQIAVRFAGDETPKPLKAPIALANGMSHPAQTEATPTQTVSAAPSVSGNAAPTTAMIDTPDIQATAPTASQPPAPAFAGLVEATADKTAPVAGKAAGGEPVAVGSVGASAPASAATAAQSAAQAAKPAPLPHPVTEQVAVHIAKASADGADKINVKLKPASLGQVDVQLDIASDGRVQVVISADRADTLDLLQRDARGLERALNDAGLQMDQQSMSFNLRDQGMPQGNAGNETTGRMGWHGGAESADEQNPALGGYLNARAAVGGVDIRV